MSFVNGAGPARHPWRLLVSSASTSRRERRVFSAPMWAAARVVSFVLRFVPMVCDRLQSLPTDPCVQEEGSDRVEPVCCPSSADAPAFVRVGRWANVLVRSDMAQRRACEEAKFSQPSSKRARVEAIDEHFIGGMRCPAESLYRLPRWELVGEILDKLLEVFLADFPDAAAVGRLYGQSDYFGPDAATIDELRFRIQQEFSLETIVQPKPEFGEASEIHATTFVGILVAAGDPDAAILRQWTVEGAPIGVDAAIATSGIFPPSYSPKGDSSDAPFITEVWNHDFEHYSSILDNASDAEEEYDRFEQRKFLVALEDGTVTRRFGKGHLNKIGLLIKIKRDGRRKRRLIVDMRRSRANRRANVTERAILPRLVDPAGDAVEGLKTGRGAPGARQLAT